ncbi:MAG: protein kinase [Candidatus Sumerlaeia bacterium]|nr:protein kinase [Candidatus Sumerlaeia bacterium]
MDTFDKTRAKGRIATPPTLSPTDTSGLTSGQMAERYLAAGVFSGKAQKVFSEAASLAPDNPHFQNALAICRLIQTVRDSVRRVADGAPVEDEKPLRQEVENLAEQFVHSADLAKCLGDVRLLDGDWERAVEAFRAAQVNGYQDDQAIINSGRIALSRPECPAAVLAFFGEIALSLGQFGQAADFLTEALRRPAGPKDNVAPLLETIRFRLLPALEKSPVRQAVLVEWVRVALEHGLTEQAIAAFREIDLTDFPHVSMVKQIARILIDQEDYRNAFDYLSRIPFDAETKSLVNEITVRLEQRGEVDTVVYLLQYVNEHDLVIQEGQRLVQDRLELETMREMAERCMRNRRFEDALGYYVNLLRLGGGGDAVSEQIARAARQAAHPKTDDLLYLGEYFFRRRKYILAEGFLSRALDLDPAKERTRHLLRRACDMILKSDPNHARARLRSGDLFLMDRCYGEAIEEYKRAQDLPGCEAEARHRLGEAYLRAGEPSLALEQFRGLPLVAADLDLLYEIHESLMKRNLFQEALQAAILIYEFDSRYRDVAGRIAELQKSVRQPDGTETYCDPKMIELIGEQAVGRYRYIEQIGSGGMGVVHKVYDLHNQCVVAMKILRETLTSSPRALDRFFREARIAATLNHPNIVTIYDYHINPVHGKSYISMEFVDGPSLRDIIEERFASGGSLTADYVAEILFYCAQLCDALETTHRKGIIHRDIKPDNVMITSDKVVKITDFGIVHIEAATFTPTGALIGTPRYMSPEQVKGGRVDCRSDIYAAGILLYEALAGMPPFVSGDIAYQQVNVVPPSPQEINPSVPDEAAALILRCLEKDPRMRFQSARDLREALVECIQRLYPKYHARFFQPPPTSTVEASAESSA